MSYFHHKARQASIVVGNTLFIDGGEVVTWDRQGNGYTNGSTLTTRNDTRTYSVDLTQPWSAYDVTITPIVKENVQAFQSGTLWLNATGNSFFQYDGGVSLAQQPYPSVQPNQLWSYALNGQSDRWTNATNLAVSQIRRVQGATYASGNGLGFALGGFQSSATSNNIPLGEQFVGGMIVYNTTSQTWANASSFGDYVYSSSGAGHFVPTFGPAGLFMPFGGLSISQSVLALDYATMYEPTTQTWKKQRVTGDIPPPVQNACVVGATGDNGTYEVYLYGGLQEAKDGWRQADPSVYILSLPSFHWFRIESNSTAIGRHRHSCNLAAGTQMISIGGVVGTIRELTFGSLEDLGGPDPLPQQGVGVFDLTLLQWTNRFESQSPTYNTPQVVKSYIAANGPTPTSFDDTAIQSWFPVKAINTTSVLVAPSTASQGLSTGGLVAAVVVPIVALLLLVALGLWFFRRRTRRARTPMHTEMSRESYGEARHSLAKSYDGSPKELPANSHAVESAGTPIYELDHTRPELK